MPEEEAKGAKGAEENEGEEEAKAESDSIEIDGEEYDPARALKTIKKQRASEDSLKAELAKYKKVEDEAKESEKSALDKLADRDAKILELETKSAVRKAADEFTVQAIEAGITDPDLALLVAERDGLFGAYDPESGTVEVDKVDFDLLLEKHPILASKAPDATPRADAGRRKSGQEALSAAEAFNRSVRYQD